MKVTMRNVTTLLSTLALATTLTAQTLPQTGNTSPATDATTQ